MTEKLTELKQLLKEKLASVDTLKDLNDLRVEFMGKKGKVQALTSQMRDLSLENRIIVGASLNDFTKEINSLIEDIRNDLSRKQIERSIENDAIDITLPGTIIPRGSIHPITKVIDEIEELFVSMGYSVVEGPEIEQDLYNFEKLNLPKGHPARDAQDSFYITDEFLLRTQTSPVQARTMEANITKGPIKIICPGKTYRRDNDDATHSHQFTQIEGLVIGQNITIANLKGTLEVFAKRMFGPNSNIRFRPSFFPFTEPSLEVDVTCFKCNGKGCALCKETGFIEILGSGMVHPNVLENCGYDSNKYTGFAFGIGPERVAMLKYGITDIRAFYTNDLRFLDTFNRIESGEIHEN